MLPTIVYVNKKTLNVEWNGKVSLLLVPLLLLLLL